jgi:hypothetical protein
MNRSRRSLWALLATLLASARIEAIAVVTPATTSITADGVTTTIYSGGCAASDTSVGDETAVVSGCGSFNRDGILVESKGEIEGALTSSAWPDFVAKSATVLVGYAFSINLTALAAPPFLVSSFPITVLSSGSVSVSSSGAAGGDGSIAVGLMLLEGGGPILLGSTGVFLAPTGRGQQTCCDPLRARVANGEYLAFGQVGASILARCDNVSGVCFPSSAEFTGVIDPTVVFDQEAFDAEYGANSFALADYYTIDYSPNIPAPEPGIAALLALGASGLALRTTRRRRSRAPRVE